MTSRKFELLPVVLIFLLAACLQYFTLVSTDVAWLSWSTAQILAGAMPYRDIVEINPPLIYALYAPPVLLAHLFGWPVAFTLKMAVIALAACSLALSSKILVASSAWQDSRNKRHLILALAALLLLTPDSFMTFGQREHLFIIFVLPYALLNLPSVNIRSFSLQMQLGVGLFAALGFCLKPHFFLIWLIIMGAKLFRTKSLKENATAADCAIPIIAMLYAGAVLLWMPDFFALLSIIRKIYSVYHGDKTVEQILIWFTLCFAGGMIIAALAGLFRKTPDAVYRADLRYLAALAIGGFLEALLQFNNWAYIIYPFTALGMLALLYPLILQPWSHIAAAIILLFFIYPVLPQTDSRQQYYRSLDKQFIEQLGAYAQAPTLYYLGLFPPPPPWFKNEGPLRWRSNFSHEDTLLTGIMQLSPENGLPTLAVRPGYEGLAQWLKDKLASDFTAKRPDLLVMEKRVDITQPSEVFFDFNEWLRQDKQWRAILAGYGPAKDMQLCSDSKPPICVLYQVFKRKIP